MPKRSYITYSRDEGDAVCTLPEQHGYDQSLPEQTNYMSYDPVVALEEILMAHGLKFVTPQTECE